MLSREERARIFLPFDALKGLKEALREKEVEYEDKKELFEESYTKLQKEFDRIDNNSKVKIVYYKNKGYTEIKGIVTNIDYIKKKIQINNTQNVNICDILNLEIIN